VRGVHTGAGFLRVRGVESASEELEDLIRGAVLEDAELAVSATNPLI
jgi:hypothetical protein